jgi:hypothetical protein
MRISRFLVLGHPDQKLHYISFPLVFNIVQAYRFWTQNELWKKCETKMAPALHRNMFFDPPSVEIDRMVGSAGQNQKKVKQGKVCT